MKATEVRNVEIKNRETVQPKRLDVSPNSNGNSRVEVQSRSSNGTSTIQTWNDGLDISPKASALSTNERLNTALSGLMGPKATSETQDSAAQYRSETLVPLEGYDDTKLNDPNHNTPKYIFGKVAQHFKLDSVQGDKAKAEDLLTAMVPELREKGLDVVAVSGDRIQVKTEVGYEWVDVIRGAGAKDPGWQWGSEGKGTSEPTKTVQEWEGKTGAGQVGNAPMGAPAGAAGAVDSGPKVLGGQIDSGKVMGILKRYSPDGQGLTQAVKDPELQKLYPGVMTFGGVGGDGKAFNADDRLRKGQNVDKLFFPNGAIVDVIASAGSSAAKWGWMPEN